MAGITGCWIHTALWRGCYVSDHAAREHTGNMLLFPHCMDDQAADAMFACSWEGGRAGDGFTQYAHKAQSTKRKAQSTEHKSSPCDSPTFSTHRLLCAYIAVHTTAHKLYRAHIIPFIQPSAGLEHEQAQQPVWMRSRAITSDTDTVPTPNRAVTPGTDSVPSCTAHASSTTQTQSPAFPRRMLLLPLPLPRSPCLRNAPP
eukprot:360339-Chlamydomonas_euryale.AAC.3